MRKTTYTLYFLLLSVFLFSCSTESTPVYQLITGSDPAEAGIVAQDATEAEEGESIQITANPNEHWVFNGWQGDLTGSQNPASVLMDRDKNITALFIKRDYPLTITIEGDGMVQEDIVTARTTEYQHGTFVQLTAQPGDEWIFFEWGGDLSEDDNPKTIEIDGEKQVDAVFKSIAELLNIQIQGEGNVEINQQPYAENPSRRAITLNPIPAVEWQFLSWDGDIQSDSEIIEISLNKEIELIANFATKPTVETKDISSITVNSAHTGGVITNNGNDQILRSGICWSNDPNPTLDDNCVNADSSQYSFDITIDNLQPASLYYTRAFASNSVGYSFGEQKQFTTLTPQPELQLWSGNTKLSLPYSASATISRAQIPTPSVFQLFEFKLIAITDSFTITNVSAVDRNNIVNASINGISNGSVISPGEEVIFTLNAGRTFGSQTDLLFRFDVAGQNTTFSYRVIFTSN